ncbi:MAG TPA: hypothetical protein VKE94_08640, partial [Gemmataceae bacterium]|nr:hypothetical protein [Gemmataceae bacterium]
LTNATTPILPLSSRSIDISVGGKSRSGHARRRGRPLATVRREVRFAMTRGWLRTAHIGLATCAVLASSSSVAHAELILLGQVPAQAFIDLGAQGFGNAPRMLTLQTNTFESGNVTPIDLVHGDAVPGANKSTTPTLGSLQWSSGGKVGIGFNAT